MFLLLSKAPSQTEDFTIFKNKTKSFFAFLNISACIFAYVNVNCRACAFTEVSVLVCVFVCVCKLSLYLQSRAKIYAKVIYETHERVVTHSLARTPYVGRGYWCRHTGLPLPYPTRLYSPPLRPTSNLSYFWIAMLQHRLHS